jgi:predicted nucleotidyltransferase
MAKIKNPNDIVDEFVSDYRTAFGEHLVSVIMYGSAVTHEYRPGVSDINMAVVLVDNSIAQIAKSAAVQKKWSRRRVRPPFFMTRAYIERSLDTYPVEFLDMRNNYRVVYGDDVLAGLEIKREHLRLQCERELKGAALHLRTAFVGGTGDRRFLQGLLNVSVRRLLPVFKAMLVLGDTAIPSSKAEIVLAVEHLYCPGGVLTEVYQSGQSKSKRGYEALFDDYVNVVDGLIEKVDMMAQEGS